MKIIYELLDTSDDEMYCTCGVFETLDEALDHALNRDEPLGVDPDYVWLEIRERQIGLCEWSNTGLEVAIVKWERFFDEETDKWEWQKHLNKQPEKETNETHD